MKHGSMVVVLGLLIGSAHGVAAQEGDSQGIGVGYGAASIAVDLLSVTTVAINLPPRATNRVGGLVGLLAGATSIAVGATKLDESGAPLAVGVVNVWVGGVAAIFGFLNLTSSHNPTVFSLGDGIEAAPALAVDPSGATRMSLRLTF